jgi:hypothetical protein
MNDDIASLNRPVHLARRDACFERAMELLNRPPEGGDSAAQTRRVGRIITLLREASEHARLAARVRKETDQERDFRQYLGLVLRNVESAHAFLDNEANLASDERGVMARFLGTGGDEAALSALTYRRWAQDILMGLSQMIRLAHGPYRTVQQANCADLKPSDQERYQLAHQSFGADLAGRFPLGDG